MSLRWGLVLSIEHCVVVDPEGRIVFHFRRQGDLLVLIGELAEGSLHLDLPGLDLAIADMLVPAPATD